MTIAFGESVFDVAKHVGTLRGALEQTTYETVRCALQVAMSMPCTRCHADPEMFCVGTVEGVMHAVRLRLGVRRMLEGVITIPGEERP